MQPNANILSKAKVQRSPGWPGLGFAINQFAWENARLGKIARCLRPNSGYLRSAPTLLSIDHVFRRLQMAGRLRPFEAGAPSRWAELACLEKRLWISEARFCAARKKGSCMLGWQAARWLIQDNDARRTAGEEGWLLPRNT